MVKRRIPSSGEQIPVIGMGSSNTFDVEDSAGATDPLREVLRALVEGGGTVIDTSPMYGRSETVLGDLIADLGLRPRLWLATKVWTRGREAGAAQIAESMRRLRTDKLELLQIHNLLDWREHLPTVRSLERAGKVRYSGITHYRADAHAELERVLTEERFDWLQVNYSLAEGAADDRLLPFWNVTNEQDWEICKWQQKGVESIGYEPGPLSQRKEYNVDAFILWYLKAMRPR